MSKDKQQDYKRHYIRKMLQEARWIADHLYRYQMENRAAETLKDMRESGAIHEMVRSLVEASKNEGKITDDECSILVALASHNIEKNRPMPIWLRDFSAKVLRGDIIRPVKRGRNPEQNFERDLNLASAVYYIQAAYEMPLYSNNELSKKVTACDVVAAATGISVDIIKRATRKHKIKVTRRLDCQRFN